MEKQEYIDLLRVHPTASNEALVSRLEIDELVAENRENETILMRAAEMAGEGMNEEALDILDTVRAKMVETLRDQQEVRDTIPCNSPFSRPDYEDPRLDNPLDFKND